MYVRSQDLCHKSSEKAWNAIKLIKTGAQILKSEWHIYPVVLSSFDTAIRDIKDMKYVNIV